jgi:hypothetical protein
LARRLGPRRLYGMILLLALGVSLSARPARADNPPRIVILAEENDELARKVRAEALNAGFVVVDAHPSGSAGDRALLSRHGANALVRVSSAEQVEVYIARSADDSPYTQALVPRSNEGEAFALRVVEQTRARLIELKVWVPEPSPTANEGPGASAQPGTSATASEETTATAKTTAPGVQEPDRSEMQRADSSRLWFDVGVTGSMPSGGLEPTPHGLLGARFEPNASWGVGLFAMLPLLESDVLEPEGEAAVSASVFAAGVDLSPLRTEHWIAGVGAGAGALLLTLRGEASDPYVAHEDRLVSGIGYVEASVARRIGSWARIKLGAMGAFSAPRPVLRFADREVPFWGRWFGGLSLRAELGLSTSASEAR